MDDKLSKEEVLHVAELGRLKLTDEEIDRFSYQLKSLFNEIDKINEIDLEVNDTLISPSAVDCKLSSDEGVVFENPEVFVKNAPRKFDSFVEIRGVFDE